MKSNFDRYVRLIQRVTTDYRWFLFYLQRMFHHPGYRERAASMIAFFLPKDSQNRFDQETHTTQLAQTLKEDGFAILENFVTKQQLEDINSFLSTKFCSDPQRPEKEKFTTPELAHKSCIHAYYAPEDIVEIPHLFDLVNSPEVLSVVQQIFGAKPTISLLQVWWLMANFDVQENLDEIYVKKPLEFHRDMDDWAEIKLFIYLTDVDEESGPHAFIKKSHTWFLPFRKRVLDLDASNFPAQENLMEVIGKAGFAWLENSYCLHRALIPTKNHRLIIAVTYSLVPLPFGPERPFFQQKNGQNFDSYINRIYIHN